VSSQARFVVEGKSIDDLVARAEEQACQLIATSQDEVGRSRRAQVVQILDAHPTDGRLPVEHEPIWGAVAVVELSGPGIP
jgi:hypothetical protein